MGKNTEPEDVIKIFIKMSWESASTGNHLDKFASKRIFLVRNGKRKLVNSLQLMKLLNNNFKNIDAIQC